jgi:hypothetical protein
MANWAVEAGGLHGDARFLPVFSWFYERLEEIRMENSLTITSCPPEH